MAHPAAEKGSAGVTAPVPATSADAGSAASSAPLHQVATTHARRPVRLLLVVVAGALLGGALLWMARSRPGADEIPALQFQIPMPDAVGSRPAISPDGTKVAFASEGKLWVRRLDRLEPRIVAGADGARSPFWSPEGLWIGFKADGALWKIRSEGGTRQFVSDKAW